MKTIVSSLIKNVYKSNNIDELVQNVETDFINLYSLDEKLVEDNKTKIFEVVNNLLKDRNFEKSKFEINSLAQNLVEQINNLEKSKMIPLVKISNAKDKEVENKMNEILEVFHKITKTHNNQLNTKGKTALEVRGLSNKEIAIINLIIEKIGIEEFNNRKIAWNPYIGLFFPSKEGFDKDNQILMMSHLDLVYPFENAHKQVELGKLASALNIMEGDIDKNSIISGSLDNTMTNAILLNNLLKGKFDTNVNALFETDEETGMSGTRYFFKEEKEDFWGNIFYDGNDFKLSKSNAPTIQKDLKVVNLDVTMGYKEPCAVETRGLNKDSSDQILNKYKNLGHKEFGFDDSTATVRPDLIAMSYCVNVGTKYEDLNEKGERAFIGGCHSMNTFSSINNVLTYNELMPELVHSISKEFNLELKNNKQKEFVEEYSNDYTSIFNEEKEYFVEDVFENLIKKYKIENEENKISKEMRFDILCDLEEYTSNIKNNKFLKLKTLESMKEIFSEALTNEELISGLHKKFANDYEFIDNDDLEQYITSILEEQFNFEGESKYYELDDLTEDEKKEFLNLIKNDFPSIKIEEISGNIKDLCEYLITIKEEELKEENLWIDR